MAKLYVGNLPYSVTDESLKDLFASYGEVVSASVIKDRQSGRSKGFGFVEFASDSESDAAIAEMNGKDVEGRPLVVSVARPMSESRPRSFDRPKRY